MKFCAYYKHNKSAKCQFCLNKLNHGDACAQFKEYYFHSTCLLQMHQRANEFLGKEPVLTNTQFNRIVIRKYLIKIIHEVRDLLFIRISYQIPHDDLHKTPDYKEIGFLGIGHLDTTSPNLSFLQQFMDEYPNGRIVIADDSLVEDDESFIEVFGAFPHEK